MPTQAAARSVLRPRRLASRWIVLVGLLSCANLQIVSAQTTGLSGRILDPSGSSIPDAIITVTDNATGIDHVCRSTAVGAYAVFGLTPGSYAIRASHTGFATEKEEGLVLQVSSTTTLDIVLQVGAASETVSVVSEFQLLDNTSPSASTQVSNRKFDDLALAQQGRIRSPVAFINLAPGVQGNYQLNGTENTAATNAIQVNGSGTQTTELYLDGVQAGRSRPLRQGSYNENAPAVDAIREFKVITTLLPADYGHTGAAVGNFSMKTGTNDLHGSIYEYIRNNAFDAQPHGTTSPLFTRQNEFGVTIGGPVRIPRIYDGRGRSFFFFSYGGSRKSGVDALQLLQLPTPAQIGGNFAGKATIYDPATTRLDPTGKFYVRDAFANNVIPASRIDPVAAKIAQYYPTPNLTGALNYSTYSGEKHLNIDAEAARVDVQVNQSNLIYGELVFTYIPRVVVSTGLPSPLVGGQSQTARTNTGQAHWQWTPTAQSLNHFVAALNRYVSPSAPVGNDAVAPNLIGLTGIASPYPPSITFKNGYSAIATNALQYQVENTYIARDVFYQTIRSQQLRFGGEYRRSQYNDQTPTPTSSSLAFSNLETASPSTQSTTGDSFASFLLGQVDSGTQTLPLEIATRQAYVGVFAQDDWRVLSNFTLNGGLRFEFQGLPIEKENRSSLISLSTPNPSANSLPGAAVFANGQKRTFTGTNFSGFGPRVGFAFQPWSTTVVRGGYGIYYSDTGLTIITAGFQPQATYSSLNNGNAAAFVLTNGFPTSTTLRPTPSANLLNGQPGSYQASTADLLPRLQEYSLSVQQALGKLAVIEVIYVGNRGTRLVNPQHANINQVDPKYLSLGATLTQSVTSAAAVSAGITAPYPGFSGTVAQALRPYPQFLTLTSLAAKQGSSNYNSLQIVFKRILSRGFSLDANYAYSRSMGYESPTSTINGAIDNSLQNAYNRSSEYSVLPSDVRHAVVLNYVYELPFGKDKPLLNRHSWQQGVFGGFSISAIQRYQSGFPLSIVTTNTLPIFNRILRPNVVFGVDPATHIPVGRFNPLLSRVINKAAFAQPVPFTFGNARPTYDGLRNFPIFSEDLAIMRRFSLGGFAQGTFYLQAFNAFNRHRYTSINTNFTDPSFGSPSGVSQPRLIQLGLRLQR